MWMLLGRPVSPLHRGAARRQLSRGYGRSTDETMVVTTLNGRRQCFPCFQLAGEPPAELSVYMHPGRSRLGAIATEQAAVQFDWQHAVFHPTLGQAELAADEYFGFLVEVSGAFEDCRGQRHDRGVCFVELRR